MRRKILAFGASSSNDSINKKLAHHAASQLENAELTLLDLNDFEMPIYSVDKEAEHGIHDLAKQFKQHIQDSDGIIISFAEHNASFSAAYKNIYDWVSRIDANVWENKPMFLMAASPGKRGGLGVLNHAKQNYGHSNKNISGFFSLPSFYQNFDAEKGILDEALLSKFLEQMSLFKQAL